ncbi:tyrosinase family protein [Bacillus thuringiensis]|uniref:tyrosinase family protein n=1 Tax=Bacillus thuringiensis TaxID=1428 RepID=UPI000BF62AB7|nr:tyrosinase family protein [Bacillus thuringiensis]PFE93517.1 tyrosinase [Bacillus thuringiensis]PGP29843.1 tyrosinase [Bacillus thuringiensis]
MRIRKNVRSLSSDEKKVFVSALLRLKKEGRYDEYVHWHHAVMVPSVLSYEPKDAQYRNGAHRGPSFLPWHREFLMQVEADLQNIDSSISIPFWDWTEDAGLPDPSKAPVWSEDLMGGNGVESEGWRVESGQFAYKTGNWPIPEEHGGPALTRRFGSWSSNFNLPIKEDLDLAMNEIFYDTPPYNASPFTIGFRNRLEGWVTMRGDNRVKTIGSQLHNRVHLWVGGRWIENGVEKVGSMVPMTSPNDPVFFLHHCFVDKVWADWQALQAQSNPSASPHYAPEIDGPLGHNLDDELKPWKRKIRDVLDITKLGYSYEQSISDEQLTTIATAIRPRSPFEAE